jgi:hypothetical protein
VLSSLCISKALDWTEIFMAVKFHVVMFCDMTWRSLVDVTPFSDLESQEEERTVAPTYQTTECHHLEDHNMKVLEHENPLLGNDHGRSSYTTE